MDLISRELAMSFPFANGKYDHENANEHFIFGCETYKEWLEQLPSEEPEIIHCQDCKYWGVGRISMTCTKGIITSIMNRGTGYCSYAERKLNG